MKAFIVQITDAALRDMEDIYNYITFQLQSPDHAMGQYNRIANAIETLEFFPERIRLMDSEPEHSMGIRPFIVDNYTVFFRIKGNCVIVLRILYSASDINRRLLGLN